MREVAALLSEAHPSRGCSVRGAGNNHARTGERLVSQDAEPVHHKLVSPSRNGYICLGRRSPKLGQVNNRL